MKSKHQVYIPMALLLCVVVKSWVFPGWASAVEILIAASLMGYRWFYEPKVEPEATKSDISLMKQAVENLGSQLATLSSTINEVKTVQSHISMRFGMGRKKTG